MSKKDTMQGKGANANPHVLAAIQAGAVQGQLVPTIPEFASQEAIMLMENQTTRIQHWLKVIPAYAGDIAELMRYPGEVKKAYAKLMGFDLSKHRSKWVDAKGNPDKARVKLYDAFVANHVSGLSLIVDLVKEKGDSGVSAIALLSGIGTLPQKLQEARLMLGRPVKARGVKASAAHATVIADASKIQADGKVTTTGKGSDKWDLTELKQKRPIEAVILLIASALTSTDCVTVAQAITKRLIVSADGDEKILGEMLANSLEQFDARINDTGEGEGDTEGMTAAEQALAATGTA